MQVFSKEQNRLVNIYVCIHKISYAFFWNFVHNICILKNFIYICKLNFRKRKQKE